MALLDRIHGPDDLKHLSRQELQPLADEVRQRLIDVVSQTGGHIGAGLGVVELTVALLYAFESPRDKIVWDVGHQGYPWKILTGRNERFPTLLLSLDALENQRGDDMGETWVEVVTRAVQVGGQQVDRV